mmetsp:Transcript_21444/g.40037  ORF Transcript_21444/g.40037 Transcript_21444/m.40037 type:complete len:183 (+) Transcript_21444:117-665(+)
MTIKTENVKPQSGDSEIPFATAIPVDTLTTSAPLPEHSENNQIESTADSRTTIDPTTTSGYETPEIYVATATASPAHPNVSASNHSPESTRNPHNAQHHQKQQPPPPGLPPGGRWVKLRHVGPNTWITCGILSAVFCVLFCFPCGIWAFCCPCDERRAYLINGRLFDEDGGMIGSAHSRVYR